MANPQKEDGHLRISNEVWDQIMMCDFRRTHLKIIDFILRLSWGCGKKSAHIPRQKDFCLTGIQESHIKKELKWLERANVLIIDWENKIYQFNKNYESWRVSIVEDYDDERLSVLIYQNLKTKDIDLTNWKEKLTNTEDNLTDLEVNLTDTEDSEGEIACPTRADDVSKNIYTDKQKEDDKDDVPDPFKFFEQNICLQITSTITEDINHWIDGGHFDEPEAIVVEAMKQAVKYNAPKMSYINRVLIDWSNKGLKTLDDVIAYQKDWEERKGKRDKPKIDPRDLEIARLRYVEEHGTVEGFSYDLVPKYANS